MFTFGELASLGSWFQGLASLSSLLAAGKASLGS
jgi:hypothetical protein